MTCLMHTILSSIGDPSTKVWKIFAVLRKVNGKLRLKDYTKFRCSQSGQRGGPPITAGRSRALKYSANIKRKKRKKSFN